MFRICSRTMLEKNAVPIIEAETEVCNQKMLSMKRDKLVMQAADDAAILEEGQRLQHMADEKRCQYANKRKQGNKECHNAIVEQIKDNAATRERLAKQNDDYNTYQSQLAKQLDQLVAHKQLTEAQARKLHQKNLLQQMDYNKLLKERIKEEELEQREKYKIATEKYQEGIVKIMSRAYFSDEIHPFAKPMHKGLQMKEKCPCSKPDHCAVPVVGPNGAPGKAPKI